MAFDLIGTLKKAAGSAATTLASSQNPLLSSAVKFGSSVVSNLAKPKSTTALSGTPTAQPSATVKSTAPVTLPGGGGYSLTPSQDKITSALGQTVKTPGVPNAPATAPKTTLPPITPSVPATSPNTFSAQGYQSTDPATQAKIAEMQRQASASAMPTLSSTAPVVADNTPKPITAPVSLPARNSVIDTLRGKITTLSSPGAEEQALQDELAKFKGESAQSIAAKEGQGRGISVGLIRGQQEKEQTQSNLQQQTLLDRIAAYSAQRQAQLTAAQNEYTMLNAEQERQDKLTAPITAGNNILKFNPTTGQYDSVYTAPATAQDQPATVQEYEYAKNGGYTGSFLDYQKAVKAANTAPSTDWAGSGTSSSGRTKDSKYLTDAGKLQDDFSQNPVVKNFATAQEGLQFASNFDVNTNNPSSDQALIFSFMKVLDPTSVVREGEYATAQQNSGVLAGLGVKLENVINGKVLNRDQREKLISAMQSKYQSDSQAYQGVVDQYTQRANSYGIDPADVITSYNIGGSFDGDNGANNIDVSSYQPSTSVAKSLQGRKDSAGETLDAQDIDYLSRYATYLGQQGLPPDQVATELNSILGFKSAGSTALNSSSDITRVANAIGQFESGGNYSAVGPATSKGDHALGKYQVMAANVPSWSKEALGYSITPQQFLASPQLQDQIAHYKMKQYADKYGTVEDVASVWFSGRPAANNNAKDVIGTSVPSYIQNVVKNYNSYA
jgi:hypothetical protein